MTKASGLVRNRGGRTRRTVLPVLGLLALAAVLALSGCGRQPAARAEGPARVDAGGLQERLESVRGKPVLLVFWATWCKPCVEEIPALVSLHQGSGDRLRILAVSLDSFLSGAERSPAVVQEFLQRTPVPYEQLVYVGSQDALFRAFDLPGAIPYALLYDEGGRVLERFDGAVPEGAVQKALASVRAR